MSVPRDRVFIRNLVFAASERMLRDMVAQLGDYRVSTVRLLRSGKSFSTSSTCSAFVTVQSEEAARSLAERLNGVFVPGLAFSCLSAELAIPRMASMQAYGCVCVCVGGGGCPKFFLKRLTLPCLNYHGTITIYYVVVLYYNTVLSYDIKKIEI